MVLCKSIRVRVFFLLIDVIFFFYRFVFELVGISGSGSSVVRFAVWVCSIVRFCVVRCTLIVV